MSSDLRHIRIKRGLTCACKAPVCDYVHCRRIINPPLNLQVAARATEHEAPPGRGPRRAHFGGHKVADDGRRRAGCGVAAARGGLYSRGVCHGDMGSWRACQLQANKVVRATGAAHTLADRGGAASTWRRRAGERMATHQQRCLRLPLRKKHALFGKETDCSERKRPRCRCRS